MNNWKDILPINRLELWILRLAFTIALFGMGFGAGLWYTRDNFKNGADYAIKVMIPARVTDRMGR